ncbi:hypothetical protein [Burkholderia territorii]|uniref:hypothetical protein n=1 Tax=Burkholderia territorii TaxID=1503055 RepID=UPI001E3A63F0|nr:hypothetical protein [Burkholderia territorii]
MTAVPQMYLEWCIGYMKFRIADAMSVGLISREADRYGAPLTMLQRARYGMPWRDMLEIGRRLFPDAPEGPDFVGVEAAYKRVCHTRQMVAQLHHALNLSVSFLPESELPEEWTTVG